MKPQTSTSRTHGVKEAFFLLKNRLLRKSVRSTLGMLADPDRLTKPELLALNTNRRREILQHAYDTCPYYRAKYHSAGFGRDDLVESENFKYIPTLTREEIRNNFEQMISNEVRADAIGLSSTGGSTGTPLTIGTDPRHALEVISWRRLNRWGASPADNSGYIYRVVPRGASAAARFAFYFPTRRNYLRATELSDENLHYFVRCLQRMNAIYVVGYVGGLQVLADYLDAERLSIPSLRFIWSTAAPLPLPLRLHMESIFQVPVYTQYGSCEFYWIAAERPDRTGLDVDWDIRHVEVLDENGALAEPGNIGQLVITDFINRAFPLIRYEIGDRARLKVAENEPAAMPVLDYVNGRVSDMIFLKSGRKVPGEFWTTIFDSYPDAIKSFSVHQKKDHSITVGFIPCSKWTPTLENKLLETLNDICDGTPIHLVPEKANVHDRGKIRFVTSELNGS